MVDAAGHNPVRNGPICASQEQLASATSRTSGGVPAHGAPGESVGIICNYLQTAGD